MTTTTAVALLLESMLGIQQMTNGELEILGVGDRAAYVRVMQALKSIVLLRELSTTLRADVDIFFSTSNPRGHLVLGRVASMIPAIRCARELGEATCVNSLADLMRFLDDICPDLRCCMPRSLVPPRDQSRTHCCHTTEWCLSVEMAVKDHTLSDRDVCMLELLITIAVPPMRPLDQLGLRWAIWESRRRRSILQPPPLRTTLQSPTKSRKLNN
jgi:hypothetical protein